MMRFSAILSVFALVGAAAVAQSSSPDALYDRGVDAITGVGPSRNEQGGIDLFRRSAALGFRPAQVALGYYYERERSKATTRVSFLWIFTRRLRSKAIRWPRGLRGDATTLVLESGRIWTRPASG